MKKLILLALILGFCVPQTSFAARLFTSGFEWQTTTTGVEFSVAVTGSPSINTTTKHSGAASFRANVTAATALQRHQFRTDAAADAYLRAYVYIATLPGANVTILSYCDGANFCGSKLKLQSDGGLQCDNSDGSSTTNGSATLSTGTWYRLEMFYDETANTCTILVDGSTDISAGAVDDIGGGGRISWGALDSATADIYWDDLAVNDTTASGAGFAYSGQTSYPGDGNVVILVPNAAGDSNCTTGDYSMVAEIPPSDTATSGSTMCELDNNPTWGDFNLTNSSTAGIDSYDTITLIWTLARIREEAAGTSNYLLRLRSASGGTTLTSAAGDAGNATARTNPVSTTAFSRSWSTTTDPTTGSAWTPTGTNSIDNMQIGVGTTDGTPDTWALTVGVFVEYVDGSAPPSGGGDVVQSEFFFE